MSRGIARHTELELEVHDLKEVLVESRADLWALHLINCLFGIRELHKKGRTRELRVFGCIDALGSQTGLWAEAPIFCIGIIDHIEMRAQPVDNGIGDGDGNRVCVISDTKTRSVLSMPSVAQKRPSRLQLMLYKYLFDNLVNSKTHQDAMVI